MIILNIPHNYNSLVMYLLTFISLNLMHVVLKLHKTVNLFNVSTVFEKTRKTDKSVNLV